MCMTSGMAKECRSRSNASWDWKSCSLSPISLSFSTFLWMLSSTDLPNGAPKISASSNFTVCRSGTSSIIAYLVPKDYYFDQFVLYIV